MARKRPQEETLIQTVHATKRSFLLPRQIQQQLVDSERILFHFIRIFPVEMRGVRATNCFKVTVEFISKNCWKTNQNI